MDQKIKILSTPSFSFFSLFTIDLILRIMIGEQMFPLLKLWLVKRVDLIDKLTILADSAKYDAACTSSGVDRPGGKGIGSAVAGGCCHTFAADGRCVSLLKVLLSNHCIYDCKYCVNRCTNDVPRAAFTPTELAELTIQFYRRNYIEGLFLSSGVLKSPDHTMEQMIKAMEILRYKYQFWAISTAKPFPARPTSSFTALASWWTGLVSTSSFPVRKA
jgi:predicted DNA-binding helix-hairpin-helix protein